jgi:hypothetical protein
MMAGPAAVWNGRTNQTVQYGRKKRCIADALQFDVSGLKISRSKWQNKEIRPDRPLHCRCNAV